MRKEKLSDKLVGLYLKSKIINKIYWLIINFISIPIIILLYILKPVKHIKLFKLYNENRIGHLAANTDLLLRRIALNRKNKKDYIGITSRNIANKQLFNMFRREILIIQVPAIAYHLIGGIINNKSLFGKSIFYEPLPFNSNEYYEFSNTKANLLFTKTEEEKGKKLLKKMGLKDKDWFVCFHARDSAYLTHNLGNECSYHESYRDSNIKNYLKAAEYITQQRGYVIRMGSIVEEKLPDLKNPKIIDYATKYRTDFGDIYLSAKCKFYVGAASGLFVIPTIFHVPVAGVNFCDPLDHTPFRKGDLFIPKKVWSIKKKRFLTFSEILKSEVAHYVRGEEFKKGGLKIIENSPEEILDLVKEMNERIDNTFKVTKEDERLQKKYWSFIKQSNLCYKSPARIGSLFLRKNQNLLK